MRVCWAIAVVLCLCGCIPAEQSRYRLSLSVTRLPDTLGAVTIGPDNAAVVGLDRSRSGVIVVAGTTSHRLTITAPILDAFPTAVGYVLAIGSGDSTCFLCWRHAKRFDTLGVHVGRNGRFIAATDGSRCLWIADDGDALILDAATLSVFTLGKIGLRTAAKSIASVPDSVVTMLISLAPQLMVWEGIHVPTARKQFSTFVPGRLEYAVADAHRAATIVATRSGYAIEWYTRNERGEAVVAQTLLMPSALYEPQALVLVGDTAVALFRSGVVLATPQQVLAVHGGTTIGLPRTIRWAFRRADKIVVGGDDGALSIVVASNPMWWLEQSIPVVYRIAIGLAVAIVLGIVLRRIGRHRRLLGTLLERSAGAALLLLDRGMRLQRLNTMARQLFDIQPSAPLGRLLGDYLDGRWERIARVVEQAIAERTSIVEEVAAETDAGERRYIVNVEPLINNFDRLEGVLVSVFDVTAQYEHWRLLNWAQLAHDMQTNLATIRLSAEQLTSSLSDDRRGPLQRILRQTNILLDRVRDLLALGRGDSVRLEECALMGVLSESVEELRPIADAQISLVVRPTTLVVRLDRRRIARALHNALTNAIKALGNDGGTIELWAELTANDIVVGVRDTGRGMDVETLRRFQQPFFTTSRTGHGFGSMIMQQMIALHGGTVEVRSELGRGTTVLFHLPRTLYVRHER